MAGPSLELQRRISELTNLRFTIPTNNCPVARPFLPVPHPTLPYLSLTLPPYDDDEQEFQDQARTLSDPAVAMKLSGPPYPYTVEDARGWKQYNDQAWDKALQVFEQALGSDGQKLDSNDEWRQAFADGTVVSYLRLAKNREEQERGEGEWLGDMGVRRWLYETVGDLDERARFKAINDERRVGDRELAWSVGYYIKPAFQGQQITTHALRALVQSFMIPALGARAIWCSAYIGNIASRRVQEKIGFEFDKDAEMWTQVDEARGGGKVQHWVTRYRGGRPTDVDEEARRLRQGEQV
ncbi:hypothetical protein ACM66B_003648 [Microbotryomycetes sp. NB124-2]